jgi:chromosome partitioning protein
MFSMLIACAGQKGGGGKTTTAISLATEWHRRGKRVLLVDADPQRSAQTWSTVGAEGGKALPTVVAMGPGLHRPDQLPALARNYDITIVDCPPRHGELQRAALMIVDLVLLPCGPSTLDAWALAESVDLVQDARTLRPALQAAVLITKRTRTALGAGARETFAASGLPVLTTELGYRVTYQEAPAAGLGPTTYEPNSPAAAEVRSLADEIEQFTTSEVTRAVA